MGTVYLHADMAPLRAKTWGGLGDATLVLVFGLVLSIGVEFFAQRRPTAAKRFSC